MVVKLATDSSCLPSCSSMALGSFMRQMHGRRLNPSARRLSPYRGHSVALLYATVSNFKVDGDVHACSGPDKGKPHRCDLAPKIRAALKAVKKSMDADIVFL